MTGLKDKILLNELHKIQNKFGYLKKKELKKLSKKANISLSEIYGTASFYPSLNLKPKAKYTIKMCENMPCRTKESQDLLRVIENIIDIKVGKKTKDGKFFLEKTMCIGQCENSPAMLINEKVYTDLDKEKIKRIIKNCD